MRSIRSKRKNINANKRGKIYRRLLICEQFQLQLFFPKSNPGLCFFFFMQCIWPSAAFFLMHEILNHFRFLFLEKCPNIESNLRAVQFLDSVISCRSRERYKLSCYGDGVLRDDWERPARVVEVHPEELTRTRRHRLVNEADLFNPSVFTLSISISHTHKHEDKLMRLTFPFLLFLLLPKHVLLGWCVYFCVCEFQAPADWFPTGAASLRASRSIVAHTHTAWAFINEHRDSQSQNNVA